MATKKTKTLTKVTPLNSSFLKELDKVEKQIEKLTSAASKRHPYIVTKIANAFKFTKYKYSINHFDDLDHLSILEDDVILYRYNNVDNKDVTFKINGEDFPFSEYYPKRWLFENFEQELESIKKEVDSKATLAKKQKQEDKKMLASVKKKLTAEELEFLNKKIS